jgi:hypothetical protein
VLRGVWPFQELRARGVHRAHRLRELALGGQDADRGDPALPSTDRRAEAAGRAGAGRRLPLPRRQGHQGGGTHSTNPTTRIATAS